MKKVVGYISVILVVVLGVWNCCFSEPNLEALLVEKGFSSADILDLTTYYYQNPQPDRLIRLLEILLTQEDVVTDRVKFGPFAHLMATIAHNDPSFFDGLKEMKARSSDAKNGAVREIINQTENFRSPQAASAEDIDYLWAEFSALGEEDPVRKIVGVLSYLDGTPNNSSLINTAFLSLQSNAKYHKKVYDVIQEESAKAAEATKLKLYRILQTVPKPSR